MALVPPGFGSCRRRARANRFACTADDLFSPKVDAFLDEQAVLNRALPETSPQPFIVRVLYSSYFYLSLASGLGAFLGWLVLEPFFDDKDGGATRNSSGPRSCCSRRSPARSGCSWGRPRGSCAATPQRAAICAAVGLGVGFVGRPRVVCHREHHVHRSRR